MIALVGYGYWGRNLARVFSDKITHIVDKEEDNLNKAKHLYGSRFNYDVSLTNVLEYNKDVKAVLIATKPETHLDLAKLCIYYNRHCWVEKPICMSYNETVELKKYLKDEGRDLRIFVDHTFLFHPAIQYLKSINIGKPLYYDSHRVSLGLFQKDVDVVKDLAIHDLAIINYLYPDLELKKKSIIKNNHINNKSNQSILCLKFNNNFTATINCNWVSPVKKREIILTGTNKSVIYDDIDVNKIKIYDTGEVGEDYNINQLGNMTCPKIESSEALMNAKKHFLNCITNENETCISDIDVALKLMKWIDKEV
tara:strand:- start:25 stop:954 length:930 start_codon:yes stop_codon:yes gene_type:complete